MGTVFGRISLFVGLILMVIGFVLAIWNFIVIRDFLVALSANRSRDFIDPNPRIWLTYLTLFLSGLLLGVGTAAAVAGRRARVVTPSADVPTTRP